MDATLTIVLDVGKTITNLGLCNALGGLVERDTRAKPRIDAIAYAALDAEGLEAWVAEVLRGFARRGRVGTIVRGGHGAAFVVLREGRLVRAPPDDEAPPPQDVCGDYDADRAAFAPTGSPRLPNGLNLGAQLAGLEQLQPEQLKKGATLPAPPSAPVQAVNGRANPVTLPMNRVDHINCSFPIARAWSEGWR